MLTMKSATRAPHPTLHVVMLLALFGSLLIAAQPAEAASSGTVDWQTPQNITNTNSVRSVLPYVAVDSNDNMHVIAQANDSIIYRNNIGGNFNAAVEIEDGITTDITPFMAIAVGPGNVLHMAYTLVGKDNITYYRRGEIRSGNSVSWSSRQPLNNERSFAANLAVDSNGVAHVVWLTSAKLIAYRTVAYNSTTRAFTLGNTELPREEGTFQTRPIITITADNKPHIVFQRGTSGSAEMYYARRESNGRWVSQNLSNSSGVGSFNGAIGTDGTGLFVAWDENTNGHDIYFRYSPDGGQNWTGATAYANSAAYSSFPNITYSAANKRAYIVWSDAVFGSSSTDTEVVVREFNPATRITGAAVRISRLGGASDVPVVAVGAARGLIVWQDRSTGQRQVFGAFGNGSGTPPPPTAGCNATLALLGGAERTNQLTVTGTITPATGCTPTQIQVTTDGSDPKNAPKAAYPANGALSVSFTAAACGPRTVRALINDASGVSGAEFSDTIIVDTDVQATVSAMNMRLRGSPAVFGRGLADTLEGGPSDGDPQYTRSRTYMLSVDGTADCSGVKNVDANGTTILISNNKLVTTQPLPGDASIGVKNWNVAVRDNSVPGGAATSGNTKEFPLSIVYDPLSTDPVAPNTNGAPVVNSGTLADGSSGNTVLRQLSFTNVNVSDNLYGSTAGFGPTLADGQRFWGVWVANSRQQVANPLSDTTLNWTAVPVPAGARAANLRDFNLNWSVFTGLNYSPTATDKAGDYYVYVRFLDGAGNPSQQTPLTVKVTLAAGYSVPAYRLPVVRN